ncbi:olfactory receptor 4B13-like [Clarias gariepinus]|uniref:olfactory receptor 142-like n=1 Tax=Clarias gariepinus TaxID=13013 RepID=UPI00234C8F8C|nr:olfactory receptor 142-like [Clarias gariepinus]
MDTLNYTTYFTLDGHVDLENHRYLYFIITFTVYIMIICFNSVIISVIYRNKCLHKPMYIFIAALLSNALFGATAFYPKLLTDLLAEEQIISYRVCLLQAFFLYTYGLSEFTLLSAMAYDRYVSICKPLQYVTVIKMFTVKMLIFLSWFVPCCEMGIAFILTSKLQLCNNKLNRIYCNYYSIVKLSCGETSLNNFFGLFIVSLSSLPPVIFIVYSYIRILAVCFKNSKDFRKKTLQTCLPHLLILIIYAVTVGFDIYNNRIESKQIPHIFTMIISVIFLVITPIVNPIIYGLKLQEIFNSVRTMISCQRRVCAFI